jgi:hypothetical protein
MLRRPKFKYFGKSGCVYLAFLNVNEQGFKVAMGGYRVIIMADSH